MDSMEDVTPQIEAVNAELKNIQEEKAKLESESLDLRRDKDEAKGEFMRNVLVHFNNKQNVQMGCINFGVIMVNIFVCCGETTKI